MLPSASRANGRLRHWLWRGNSASSFSTPGRSILNRPTVWLINQSITRSPSSFTQLSFASTYNARPDIDDQDHQRRELREGFFQPRSIHEPNAKSWDVSNLYERLIYLSRTAQYQEVQDIVQKLLYEHGELPDHRIFNALICVNADAKHGSAAEVSVLLQEMDEAKVTPDTQTYHAVLKVLAIHPDHLLRSHILDCMRERWLTLTAENYHDLILGLIRERQIEMAIEQLYEMHAKKIIAEPWLYDTLIFVLCDMGEIDESLHWMQHRLQAGELSISSVVWSYLLDAASRAMHLGATRHVFYARVATGYLSPSSGTYDDILACAARYGDVGLALLAFQKLSERGGRSISLRHHESMIEAHLNANDLRSAFKSASATVTTPFVMTEHSTRPLFAYLIRSNQTPAKALTILNDLRNRAQPIPLAVINTIIEAYLHFKDFDSALALYNTIDLYSISSGPTLLPDTYTYNMLFRGCVTARDKPRAMHLVKEMVELQVSPNILTYDRLILVCISCDPDLDDAWKYLDEVKDAGGAIRRGTAVALAKKACELGDERIDELAVEYGGILDDDLVQDLKGRYGLVAEEEEA